MHRLLRSRRSLIAIPPALALITSMSAGFARYSVSAQNDPGASHPAHLHTGTCESLGDVGGVMVGTNGLVFALAELNDSDYLGLARLLDNGDGSTLMTVYILHNDQVDDVAAGAGAPVAPAASSVAIEGFAFNPQTIEIAAGDTVTWTNSDAAQHTVTQDPSGSGFASGGLAQGATFENTFAAPGTYEYFCEFHPMSGTVVVS